MSVVHLAHGFNVSDRGLGSVGRLRPHLEHAGMQHRVLSYPWTRLLTLRANNRWAVEELADRVQPGDGFIAHSNGCWIGMQAAEIGAPLAWMIFVNPALHQHHEIPEHVYEVLVYHSAGDIAVRAGRWWRYLTRLAPWRWCNPHHFGAMGAVGYQGRDSRIRNFRMPDAFGHSGVWGSRKWLQRISDQAWRLNKSYSGESGNG